MNWDSKGRKSFGRAQGRWVKEGKLRASNSELVSSLVKKRFKACLRRMIS